MLNTIADRLTNTNPFSQALSQSGERTEGQILRWTQPKRLQSDYLLRSNDQVLGTLQYENNHFIRRAAAKTAEGEWRFKYTRFSLPKVTISNNDNLLAEAILETNWGWYGNLDLPDGCQYLWKPTEPSENEFCFLTPEDHPVVYFRPRFGFFKLESEVEIDPAVLHNPQLPLLTMLGWFLVLLRLR